MTKVKICGLSREEDIDAVNRSLPDFIGFVFAQSRRKVDLRTAARLKEKLDSRVEAVGVFVNEDIDCIARLCREGIVDMVQLHGDEDDGYIERLKETCGRPVIKAVSVGSALPILTEKPDYLLFDTASAARGGAGKAFDWNILKGYEGLPYFLAGGLDASNVVEAVDMLSPFCVDVSSGVETDGGKDAEKIDSFVQLVRGMNPPVTEVTSPFNKGDMGKVPQASLAKGRGTATAVEGFPIVHPGFVSRKAGFLK